MNVIYQKIRQNIQLCFPTSSLFFFSHKPYFHLPTFPPWPFSFLVFLKLKCGVPCKSYCWLPDWIDIQSDGKKSGRQLKWNKNNLNHVMKNQHGLVGIINNTVKRYILNINYQLAAKVVLNFQSQKITIHIQVLNR